MNTRRLDQLEKRIDGRRAPDDDGIDLLDADRLAALSDEELQKEMEHLAKVIEALDAAGALDDMLANGNLTRDDLWIFIDPADPSPLATVRRHYQEYIDAMTQ